MRVSLKSKLTALISLLVLLVVLATSTLYLSSLTRQALAEVESKAQYVANEIYEQARTVLAQSRLPAGANPEDVQELRRFVQATLAADSGLTSLMQSAVAYSPSIYYVAITDADQQVLIHTDPGEIGKRLVAGQPLTQLIKARVFDELRIIYGPARVYEVVLPLDMKGKPLGDVRVGVSTWFVRDQLTPELRVALAISALAVVLATLSAGILSFRMLRPLKTISQSVDRLARGEYSETVEVRSKDEWGILSSKLNLLGEQMRGEKEAFVALKENLDQLLSNLTDGLLLFDKQDRLVLATPAVERFLRRLPEKLTHLPATEVFSGERPLDRFLQEAFRSRRSLAWKVVESPGDRETPRVAVSAQFVEEEGEPVGCLVTFRDASTRAHLEDQLDLTAKLAALGRLTSGVAHEVKNPLNAMVLQLEVLRTKLGTGNERVKPQLEILSAEIRRLDRVVKTFLDFTRPVELHATSTDVETLVREVFTLAEPQARENKVQLVFERDGALPPLRLDPDLMKQALLNLVLNGCQAMPRGGELRVTPNVLPERLELEIADQGVGIPPETQPRIFSLYYTTKPGGNGIGLAMAYRIIQLHNGTIDFSSEVNRGTKFRVVLPR